MTEQKLKELLDDLSLDEKIGQLLQLTGLFFSDDGLATGPMESMNLTKEQVSYTGTVLSTVGAKKLKDIQNRFMEAHPHHIPLAFMADVINGYRTVFPFPLAQGCSFDPELSKEIARISAKETAKAGVHVTFSPMVDLVRDARWGRVMESTGEDLYLNSLFGKAMIEGYQGDDVADSESVSSCVKHFAAYGAPVGGREYNQVEISERSLYEEYLPSYKAGIDAGTKMVMTSFNTLGRIPCTGNKKLMKDLLRDTWGFEGVLISDWAAIRELEYHGVAEDDKEAACLAMNAGVDIDMVTSAYSNNLKSLLDEGKITMDMIDESVYRVLKFKNDLGLFENPYKGADEEYDEAEEIDKEHALFARKAAPETFVLLKNDGILPLPVKADDKCRKIAFVGPYMEETKVCGAWSHFFKEEENVTLKQALLERNDEIECVIANGCTTLAAGEHVVGFKGPVDNDTTEEEMQKMMDEAVEVAKDADIVVMPLGEFWQYTAEGAVRTDITIPAHQMELFRRVAAVNDNIVVVTFSGRPLDLREVSKKARAVLHVWYPGTETGHAVMDVLFGDANPGGRLSMSFPYNVGQVPVYYNELSTGRPKTDDFNRFCSRYMDAPNKPLYVFGYGLDYTTYEYSNLRVSSQSISAERPVTVSVDVTNTGNRDGKEVVQMYIQDVKGSVARPVRQLKGFKKISLSKGEMKTVTFEINVDMLKFYDINMNYVAEPGEFKIYVGRDSNADMATVITM